ncbi:ribonuclease HI family protein [Comamonas sp. CMM02]|uniref:Ribonuclease HI family protein n=2 Tax=Comamonadaceae TaxID=80864 RepID=A0ABR8SFN9_9BURK|nr:ribonuclease HI family protein [Comamonas avium]MBD9402382.1 ribonuclease HI family protein [Comamonas sp. CMM02]
MPNPGRMAIGVVLTGPDGSQHTIGQVLHGRGCNNEAELRALQAGLLRAQELGASSLRIYTDSQWVIEQLAPRTVPGVHVRPTLRLAPWLEVVQPLVHSFEQVQWRWIPRHLNTEADALARQASLSAQEA